MFNVGRGIFENGLESQLASGIAASISTVGTVSYSTASIFAAAQQQKGSALHIDSVGQLAIHPAFQWTDAVSIECVGLSAESGAGKLYRYHHVHIPAGRIGERAGDAGGHSGAAGH
jgi:hypothetical protein